MCRKQALNRGFTVPDRNISGVGLSFSLDKILTVLTASQNISDKRMDVVVCISSSRAHFFDETHILYTLWSCGIQCAVIQANSAIEAQDIAKDLGTIHYIVCTEDGILRVLSWTNDRFEEKLLNRDEIIAHIKEGVEQKPMTSSQSNNLNELTKYNRSNGGLGRKLPSVTVVFSIPDRLHTNAKKRYESVLTTHINESLELFNHRVQIVVIAVDLQPNIIRGIVSIIDRINSNFKDVETETAFVIERFPNYKRSIKEVIDSIMDTLLEKKPPPIVCLYNLKDNYYRFIL